MVMTDVQRAAVAGRFAASYVSIRIFEVEVVQMEMFENLKFGVDTGFEVAVSILG